MMALGMFVFSLSTLSYQELQRRSGWRLSHSERIGAPDAIQFLGPEGDTISLTGTAPCELMRAQGSLDDLRDMAKDGEAWPLVDGTGRVYGAFVIAGIDERQRHFFADGTPRQIDFGLDLVAVEDPAANQAGA